MRRSCSPAERPRRNGSEKRPEKPAREAQQVSAPRPTPNGLTARRARRHVFASRRRDAPTHSRAPVFAQDGALISDRRSCDLTGTSRETRDRSTARRGERQTSAFERARPPQRTGQTPITLQTVAPLSASRHRRRGCRPGIAWRPWPISCQLGRGLQVRAAVPAARSQTGRRPAISRT